MLTKVLLMSILAFFLYWYVDNRVEQHCFFVPTRIAMTLTIARWIIISAIVVCATLKIWF